MKKPSASLIIALDSHSNPDLTIPAIINQTEPNFETIIVDNGVNKRWARAIKRYDTQKNKIRFYAPGRLSRSSSWNYGAAQSGAKILIFMGDDFRPNPNFVKSHLAVHQKHRKLNAVAIGPAIFGKDIRITNFMKWAENSGRLFGVAFKNASKVPGDFFWGANCSIKREFFVNNRGFDEAFPYHAWDDYELGMRLNKVGMKVYFEPGAVAQHDHKVTLKSRIKAMRQAGESAIIFENKHPGVWPWQATATTNTAFYYKKIIKNYTHFLLSGNLQNLHSFYSAVEDASFAKGYNKARLKS